MVIINRDYRKFSGRLSIISMDMWIIAVAILSAAASISSTSGIDVSGSSSIPFLTVEPPLKMSFSNSTGGMLHCAAGMTESPSRIMWINKDGRSIQKVRGILEVLTNGSLWFPPFAPHKFDTRIHDATYRCRIETESGVYLSQPSHVRGVVISDYEVQVYDKVVIVGNTGVLRCSIPPYVQDYVVVTSWLHDSAFNIYPSLQGDGKYHLTPTGELIILNIGIQDEHSRFQCRTLHKLTGATQLSRTLARLIISEAQGALPPRISRRTPFVSDVIGSDVLLQCIAEGDPPPQYTWFHGSTPHVQSKRSWKIGGSLALTNVQEQDTGEYHCVANNSAGTSRYTTHLDVRFPLSAELIPKNREIDVGTAFVLTCRISGQTANSVAWFKDGKKLRSSERILIQPKNQLQITVVQKGDEGVYQCEVRSQHSFAHSYVHVTLGATAPLLNYRFISQTLQPGPSVSLKCIASGTPTPNIQWSLDGFDLPQSHRYLVGQYVSSHGDVVSHVNITSIRVTDGGSYTCVASNEAGETRHSARVNIYGAPKIRPMGRISAISGENFNVTCPVGGYPIDKIAWKKDGVRLPVNHRQKTFSNGTLTIAVVSRGTDDGLYTCSAFDRQGRSDTQTFTLSVMVPPVVLPFSFDDGLHAGERVGVACIVSRGDTPISVKWGKDGKDLDQLYLPGLTMISGNAFSSTLMIDDLKAEHTGLYLCNATNMWGHSSHSSELKVNVPPRWIIEPSDTSVALGGSVILQCLAEGYPTPTIHWSMEAAPGEFQKLDSNLSTREFRNGTLNIIRSEKLHEGRYLCEANNGVGGGVSKVITLQINEPPWFTNKDRRIRTEVNTVAKVSCQALGDPPLSIIWTENGDPLPPYPRYEVTERKSDVGIVSDLLIRSAQVSDSGNYVCEASNPYGTFSSNIELIIQDVPEAPNGVTATQKASRSLLLSWEASSSSNAPILAYNIKYTPHWKNGKGRTQEVTVEGDQQKVRIQRLSPATLYSFSVSAENSVGRSQPSVKIHETTDEELPSGYPRNIRVVAIRSTSLQVTWDPPFGNDTNGLILGYYLGYKKESYTVSIEKKEGMAYNFTTVGVEGHGVTTATLTGLRPFSRYSIVMQAFNSKGAGPSTPPTFATTLEDRPGSPPLLPSCDSLSSSSVRVRWNPPSKENVNGIIISYRVVYKLMDLEGNDERGMMISEKNEATLMNLFSWNNYSISIAASTRIGEGVFSDDIICATLEAVPDAPGRIKAVATGMRSAIISWSVPKNQNGRILGYTVYWAAAGTRTQPLSRFVKAPQMKLTLHDLRFSVNEIWVEASTGAGKGPASKIVIVKPSKIVTAGIWSVGGNLTTEWKSSIQMPCRYVGVPPPEITWYHSGEKITKQRERIDQSPDGALTVHSPTKSDGGLYKCTALNIHGADSITYQLRILVPPSDPLLHVTETTASSIRLQWSVVDAGGSPATKSMLTIRPENRNSVEIAILGSRKSYVANDLECGRLHTFYVTVSNRIGISAASKEVTARTKGRTPEAPPQFQFITCNSTQATLYLNQWEAGGCPITHFDILLKNIQHGIWDSVGNNIAPTRTFAVSGLISGKKYHLRVKAFNSAGSTEQEYTVETPTVKMKSVLATSEKETWELSSPRGDSLKVNHFWKDPKFVIPAVVSIIAILLTLTTLFICIKKKGIILLDKTKNVREGKGYAATAGGKGNIIDGCRIYSPVLQRKRNSGPQTDAIDNADDNQEEVILKYAARTYSVHEGGSSPPVELSSPIHLQKQWKSKSKAFSTLFYHPPSLHDVDAPNMGIESLASRNCPNDEYGSVAEFDDFSDANRRNNKPKSQAIVNPNQYMDHSRMPPKYGKKQQCCRPQSFLPPVHTQRRRSLTSDGVVVAEKTECDISR